MRQLRHAKADRKVLAWLRCLADPMAPPAPSHALDQLQTERLVEVAAYHSVLPAVARRLRHQPNLAVSPQLIEHVSNQLVSGVGDALLLAHHGALVVAALRSAGVPAILVKGPVFARRLYPERTLRTFSDIDVLVPPGARAKSRPVMRDLGFTLTEEPKRTGADYHEDQWTLDGHPRVLVEIQDNLVHAPSLAGMSVGHADIIEAGAGDPEAPGALLLTAVVHGAIGHQFEFLRFLVDICQAGRGHGGPIDIGMFRQAGDRTRTGLAACVALDLAGRFFREPDCLMLARELGHPTGRTIGRFLISSGTVLRSLGPTRRRDSWRRKALREVLKAYAGRQPRSR